MSKDMGASRKRDRAGHEQSQQAVSADTVAIPSTDNIPSGAYCYASLGPMDERGHMKIKGICPYWERRDGEKAYCAFLDYETEFTRELLWDQVKVCGVGEDDGF